MRRQIQKSSNKGSSYNQEFLEPPTTPSFAADVKSKENDDVDTDQFSFENLRSFYRGLCEEEMAKISRNASFQSESPGSNFPPRRAINGLSTDSASTSTFTSASASPSAPAADGASFSSASTIPTAVEVGELERDVVVIVTYSRSPCEDFRRSMEEIVAARVESEGEVNREFMEELLFRYLELNNDKYFRDILRAFLGLIGASREDPPRTSQRRRRWGGGFISKRKLKLKLDIKNMHKLCCKYRC